MRVRKIHPYDGTPRAGKPIGKLLTVIKSYPHSPIDGPGNATVCELSDGSWEFLHNLHKGMK